MARAIVGYSLALEPGDRLRIEAPALAQPLILVVYQEAIAAGAHITTRISLEGLAEIFLRQASPEQLAFVSEVEQLETDYLTARLVVAGAWNTRELGNIVPERLALVRRARAQLMERLMARKAAGQLRSCLTAYPTQADAQQAEMSLAEYEDFVFAACFCDREDPIRAWQQLSAQQATIVGRLNRVQKLRIEAVETELELNVAGRLWINSDGRANFPSGEIFTAPVEDSVNGQISFDFPAVLSGRAVHNVRLRFDRGRVVAASATRGEDFLRTMLGVDEGASVLGEVAFGTNPGIQRFSYNILFDEKIGGTMHFALGAAYPECGGRNLSAIHWDMIKDFRSQGRVYADGRLIYEQGRFLI